MTKYSSDLVANETSEKSCPFVLEKLDGEIDLSNGNIPLVDLKANYRSMKAEIDASIADVLASCYFIGGPQCKEFEKSFSDYCGVKHCIGVNSGTDALFLALKHVGVKEGDDVIIPANTFVATALAVSAVGANVVLVDCLADTMMMDTSKLEAVCTPKTKVRTFAGGIYVTCSRIHINCVGCLSCRLLFRFTCMDVALIWNLYLNSHRPTICLLWKMLHRLMVQCTMDNVLDQWVMWVVLVSTQERTWVLLEMAGLL